MNHHSLFEHPIKAGHNAFAYIIEGEGFFEPFMKQKVGKENLVIFEDGDKVQITTEDNNLRFLLISGKPINEPVAWSGPIVMNTQEEIRIAFEEYRNGTFIKKK
jgi:redox-sensitive bicupin YhaK (pirin superfamily)